MDMHSTRGFGYERLWRWFGLSRASFCVMPRTLMQEMPDEWQGRMAALLEEYDATYDQEGLPRCRVVPLSARGRFMRWPDWLVQYRHPDVERIELAKKGRSAG